MGTAGIEMNTRLREFVRGASIKRPALVLGIAIAVLLAGPGHGAQPNENAGSLGQDEIAVMAAVLDAAYAGTTYGWVMVARRTATFACNPPENNGLTIGGCNGMRFASESAEQRLNAVRKAIPEISKALATDLLEKSQHPVVITKSLPCAVPQSLWSPGDELRPERLLNPVFAAYFSRVGFNPRHTQALVYLATINWMDSSRSVGQYV